MLLLWLERREEFVFGENAVVVGVSRVEIGSNRWVRLSFVLGQLAGMTGVQFVEYRADINSLP
jgi:hypothetical protein